MSYWCHSCRKGFTPQSVNCPHCGSDFIEWTNEPLISSDEEEFSEEYEDHHLWNLPPPRRLDTTNLDYTDLARWFLSMGMGLGRSPSSLEDFGIGQSFDDILNMSFEQDLAQSSGPPPASKRELSRLKKFKINNDHIASNLECTVCTEKYRLYELCHLLPCKHFFHQDCIKPWLKLHNTCPVCRYELKTDDIEYEAKKKRVSTPITTTTSPLNENTDVIQNTTINTTPPPPNSNNTTLTPTTMSSTRVLRNSSPPINRRNNQSHRTPKKKRLPHKKNNLVNPKNNNKF